MNYLLLGVNILLLVTGQTMWKIGIGKGGIHGFGGALLALLNPWVFGGIVVYGVATVIYIYLLSRMPLSLLYPLQSLAYIVAVFVSVLLFHEHVSAWRWVGVLVILFGASLVVK